ncbi:flagellin FliC [Sansalvadorimonas sp. 2012CJ34-2]|uniref:Flagellin n=1 Tax=Parendozoicomonas callyspongiae TaxID=2942213 RepID=A0ABT0PFF4_9GAMM|nr:flagellin [Sansalvadorimonas sp. 2012CJ34-2]MCL6270090.1 flagellin FliC [Sansalvadorimonas sp. 2012CJ34-2]
MITINTNTTAMVAQSNLNNTQNGLSSSMLKLSTGLRINSASDDAAGMQISNRMQTQINGLNVAQRNANDAISMAQTAEGAMTEVTDMLNRMRDLSLQSANDTNTAKDRMAMQKEMNALAQEITRVAEKTEFAGIDLLSGTDGSKGSQKTFSFQVGANANETIEFSLTNIDAESLEVNGNDYKVGGTAKSSEAAALNTNGDIKIQVGATAGDEDDITISTTGKTAAELKTEIAKALGTDETNVTYTEGAVGAKQKVEISANAVMTTDAQKITAGTGPDTAIGATAVASTTKGLDVTSKTAAQAAVGKLDSALASIDDQRAHLGATQNRLESTIDNLSSITTNMTASQSRIKNVDFAKETTNMTSKQMMMQAGSTVLSQAKQMPQYAAQLLR